MRFEPPIVRDAVVDEWNQQRVTKRRQLIAEPCSGEGGRAIWHRLDRQLDELPSREVDRFTAIDHEPIGKHLHEHGISARASPREECLQTAAIGHLRRRECAETSYTIPR